MPLFSAFRQKLGLDDDSSGDECQDSSAGDLSWVGVAAYDCLRKKHNHWHHDLWNVTKGKVCDLQYTPRDFYDRSDRSNPEAHHDDWFAERMQENISRTEEWCDILTLGEPDGLFLDGWKKGLKTICEKELILNHKITIRIMFGNVLGMPVNCTRVIDTLTADLPPNASDKINLWVGSWRKGVSWNHAKIIATDGRYLWTGGHNCWDRHYLKANPTNDLSIEMEGNVARDAHRFANFQWGYIVKKQSTAWGRFVDKNIPDGLDVPRTARVTVSAFPEATAAEFPPFYNPKKQRFHKMLRGPSVRKSIDNDFVPVITMGRYGTILKTARPSDDAFVAMFNASKTIIRCALQDIGPPCIPHTKLTLPGTVWPEKYLNAMAHAMWTKGVDVEIILSNPLSIPDNVHIKDGCYGVGW